MSYVRTCLFTGPVSAKHDGINNSCVSPDQTGTSCRLILEQLQVIPVDLSEASDNFSAETVSVI